jgi:hypothetical protein
MTDDGGPAFPNPSRVIRDLFGDSANDELVEGMAGMSLRDYFAAAALAGELARPLREGEVLVAEVAAEFVYDVADAMLEARKRKDGE